MAEEVFDKNGKIVSVGRKVRDNDGYEYEIIFCDGLGRVMIDEPIQGKMFEIDDFEIELVPTHRETVKLIKESVAKSHGYRDDIMGTAWEYAMMCTHRSKVQLQLYDCAIDEIVKHFANLT